MGWQNTPTRNSESRNRQRRTGFYICRSTIIRLISAMALAGFSPLGQVCVQFMIVWQR